jgi:hypothetical protein
MRGVFDAVLNTLIAASIIFAGGYVVSDLCGLRAVDVTAAPLAIQIAGGTNVTVLLYVLNDTEDKRDIVVRLIAVISLCLVV